MTIEDLITDLDRRGVAWFIDAPQPYGENVANWIKNNGTADLPYLLAHALAEIDRQTVPTTATAIE